MGIKNVKVLGLLYLSILWTGCSLERPRMDSSLEVRMIVPQGSFLKPGNRALAPEITAMRAELWQNDRLMFMVTGGLEKQNDGTVFVIFSFGQVPLASYALVAYAVDTNRVLGSQDIQVAQGAVELTLESPAQVVILKLRPNDALPGNVYPLEAGLGVPGTPLGSKKSIFYKLPIPLEDFYHVSVGTLETDTELTWLLQDRDGNLLPLNFGAQSKPWAQVQGPLYLSVYNGGLTEKASVEVYFDLAGTGPNLLDRRPLLALKKRGMELLTEAEASLGNDGELPASTTPLPQRDDLKTALTGADSVLPPNYLVTETALGTAQTVLTAAMAALEATRLSITISLDQWDGTWKPLDTGEDLVSLVGVPGKFGALDIDGVLWIKDSGFWEQISLKPPVKVDLITKAGNLIVAAARGSPDLYTFDGVSWSAYTTTPGGFLIQALSFIQNGVAVLDEAGNVRIFDGTSWTLMGMAPVGTTSLGAAGERLFAWNVNETVLKVWEGGRWGDPGFPVQIGTRSLTGSTDTVIALVKN